MKVHPDEALYKIAGGRSPVMLAACEHYAGNERFIKKALALQKEWGPIFDLACDLEDGAAVGQEQAHRELAVASIRSTENFFGRAGVRVHGPESEHFADDVRSVLSGAGQQVAFITIPKMRTAEMARSALSFIEDERRAAGLEDAIPVHLLIETPSAVSQALAIASLPEVESIDFGILDFISEHEGIVPLGASESPEQFSHPLIVRAKTAIVAAAVEAGVVATHNVTVDVRDPEKAFADARRARQEMGFSRMWSIHPDQIRPIVRGMSPDEQEVRASGEVLLRAQSTGWAPLAYEGKLYDRAAFRYFWGVLKRAHRGGMDLPEEVRQAFFARHAR